MKPLYMTEGFEVKVAHSHTFFHICAFSLKVSIIGWKQSSYV